MLSGIDLVRKQTKQDNSIATLERIVAYRKKQQTLISKVHKKLIKNENVSIGFYGDSMTYGYDSASVDRRPHSVTDNAGGVYNNTIAGKTFPEAFKDIMDRVYGVDTITVKTRAVGGDYVSKALERWLPTTHPFGTDLIVMNYGINDSRNRNCPYVGETDKFIEYYRQLIEAEIDNGSAIVLMTPFKSRSADYRVEIFENAVINLANEYNIPIILGDELSENMSYSHYSDGTHWNTQGYTYIGTRLASCFISNGVFNTINVSENSQLLVRRQNDGIWWSPKATGTMITSSTAYPTPDETADGAGIALRIGQDETIYYTFYAEKDLWIAPHLGLNAATSQAKVELDFGVPMQDYCFDSYPELDSSPNFTNRHKSTITYARDVANNYNRVNLHQILTNELDCIRTVTKGWHTLSITAEGGTVGLGGLIFLDVNYFVTMRNKHTKFKGNVIVDSDNKTDYRDIRILRNNSGDGKSRSVHLGANIQGGKVCASMYVKDIETNQNVNVMYLTDKDLKLQSGIMLEPTVPTNGLALKSVRQGQDGITYRQNVGLYQGIDGIHSTMALYDNDAGNELSQIAISRNAVLCRKLLGQAGSAEMDLGNSTYKFKDIYATNGVIQTSDRESKMEITDTDLGLEFINKLRPVNFKYKINDSDRIHTGLIAQEVEKVLGDNDKAMLIKNKEGYALRYHELIAPLIRSVQELSEEVQELKKEMNTSS